jgi:hypothetical protein
LFDCKQFYENFLKVVSQNYSGNQQLGWGAIKLNLKTRPLEELRKKFIELNVTMR